MQRRERLDSDVETHHTVGGRSAATKECFLFAARARGLLLRFASVSKMECVDLRGISTLFQLANFTSTSRDVEIFLVRESSRKGIPSTQLICVFRKRGVQIFSGLASTARRNTETCPTCPCTAIRSRSTRPTSHTGEHESTRAARIDGQRGTNASLYPEQCAATELTCRHPRLLRQ